MRISKTPDGSFLRNDSGFTLLEVTVVTAAVAIVLVGAMEFTSLAAEATEKSSVSLVEMRDRGEGVQRIRELLSKAHLQRISADGETLWFSVPVALGVNGSYMDEEGQLLFGTSGPEGPVLDGTYSMSFVRQSTIDEAVLGRFLNFDADRVDRFDIGTLEVRTDTGQLVATLLTKVVRAADDPGGDIDGDGAPDPLFEVDGLQVRIRFGFPNPAGLMVLWQLRFPVIATSVL